MIDGCTRPYSMSWNASQITHNLQYHMIWLWFQLMATYTHQSLMSVTYNLPRSSVATRVLTLCVKGHKIHPQPWSSAIIPSHDPQPLSPSHEPKPWSSAMVPSHDPQPWSPSMILIHDPQPLSPAMILIHDLQPCSIAMIPSQWSSSMVPCHYPHPWSSAMIPAMIPAMILSNDPSNYPQLWSQVMIPSHDPLSWSPATSVPHTGSSSAENWWGITVWMNTNIKTWGWAYFSFW